MCQFCITSAAGVDWTKDPTEELSRSLPGKCGGLDIDQTREILQIISHELRGPLSTMIQLADYIHANDDLQERLFLLSNVKQTTVTIMETLSDISKTMELKINPMPRSTCSLSESIKRTIESMREPIQVAKPVFRTNIGFDLIDFPKTYLDNILSSLIANAIKYRKPDQVLHIQIEAIKRGDQVFLGISDNGIGMDIERHRSDLFHYKRVLHTGYSGSGLSLYMVKKQLETFGGEIQVSSEPGKGAKFTLSFPARKDV